LCFIICPASIRGSWQANSSRHSAEASSGKVNVEATVRLYRFGNDFDTRFFKTNGLKFFKTVCCILTSFRAPADIFIENRKQ
jgi:hypothetical protein